MSKHAPTLNSSLRRNYASSFAPEGDVQSQVQPLNVSSSSSVPTSSSVQASEKLYQKVLRNVRNAGRPTVFSTREATATAVSSRGRSSTTAAAAATYLGLRRRDARDASGKRYRVQIPRRMLLSVVVVFLVLPACTFLYVVARDDDHRRPSPAAKETEKEEERSGVRSSANDDDETTTTTTTTTRPVVDAKRGREDLGADDAVATTESDHDHDDHDDHDHDHTVVRDETVSEPSINATKHKDGLLLHLLNETRTRNSTAATTTTSEDPSSPRSRRRGPPREDERPPERATPLSSLDVVSTNDPEPNDEDAAMPQDERSKD